ncbi:flavonoid 3',5'-hydroxylase 1-like isoform X2 [Tripterygium wilfordii]|uniref:flavonoid 3',5'-hydroxylase 1-like isoform X2 n=1 Tax=Tripterygium wilfordii TaxID=458696 RepID=UPI0018F82D76|nr:flavonoid 3',5'-hydroxylase 1-like isoform X2 [Tripterygium wilfordii]
MPVIFKDDLSHTQVGGDVNIFFLIQSPSPHTYKKSPNMLSQLNYEKGQISGAILAIPILIISVLLLIFLIKKPGTKIAPLPPGPRGFPIIGYLPFLGTHLHHTFTKLAQIYGPIYKLKLGNKLYVVISSPSLAKEVVRDKDSIFANRDPPISVKVVAFGGNDVAWLPHGPDWIKMRKVFVREMLSNTSLDACYSLRKQEVEKSIKKVHDKAGECLDFGELAFVTLINTMMKILWGGTLQGEEGTKLTEEFRKAVAEYMVIICEPNVSDSFPVLARFDLQGVERRARKIGVCMEEIVNSIIKQHRSSNIAVKEDGAGNKKGRDFLQIVLELQERDDPATSITMNQAKGLLMDVVTGGTDTTSTMVEWAMAEIMMNPKIMKKVQQELDQVVGVNNSVEEFHLPKLHYLDAVVKETSRLHPALPMLVPRCPTSSATIGGFTIPRGTQVFLNIWAIQRDPEHWDNPLEFRPERFLNGEDCKLDFSGNNFKYLPFGSGRRVCAGIPLAEKTLMYLLASLLYSFDWKLPADEELELSDKFGLVVKKAKPLIVIPTPRLPNPEH